MKRWSRTYALVFLMTVASVVLCWEGDVSGSEIVVLWPALVGLIIGGKAWMSHVATRGGKDDQ